MTSSVVEQSRVGNHTSLGEDLEVDRNLWIRWQSHHPWHLSLLEVDSEGECEVDQAVVVDSEA